MRTLYISLALVTALIPLPAGDSPLAGRWTNGRISMIQYRDAWSGAYKPPTGSHFAYEFRADGTYTFIGLMQSTVYNCTTSMFSQENGTYDMDNNGFVSLHPQTNPYRMTNNCAPSSNREAPGKLVERMYRYQVSGNRLELIGPNNNSVQAFQRSAD